MSLVFPFSSNHHSIENIIFHFPSIFFHITDQVIQTNEAVRKEMEEKLLPRIKMLTVPIEGGYSEFFIQSLLKN